MKTDKNQTPPLASEIPVHCAFDDLVDVVTLTPNPRNMNKHPDKQVALLAKVIRHQGWRAPIVVSKRSGFVVAGHGRLAAAALLQVEKVPVNFQDFATEADEHAHLIADNRIAELAETDETTLAELLAGMKEQSPDFDLGLTGFSGNEVEKLLAQLGGGEPNPEEEWKGMPEFSHEDQTSEKQVIIHFARLEHAEQFGKLIGQKITESTRSLWFPKAEPGTYADKRYVGTGDQQ